MAMNNTYEQSKWIQFASLLCFWGRRPHFYALPPVHSTVTSHSFPLLSRLFSNETARHKWQQWRRKSEKKFYEIHRMFAQVGCLVIDLYLLCNYAGNQILPKKKLLSSSRFPHQVAFVFYKVHAFNSYTLSHRLSCSSNELVRTIRIRRNAHRSCVSKICIFVSLCQSISGVQSIWQQNLPSVSMATGKTMRPLRFPARKSCYLSSMTGRKDKGWSSKKSQSGHETMLQ